MFVHDGRLHSSYLVGRITWFNIIEPVFDDNMRIVYKFKNEKEGSCPARWFFADDLEKVFATLKTWQTSQEEDYLRTLSRV